MTHETVMDYADGTTNTFRAIGEGAADYPPSNLIAFSEWLAQTIAQIPEAHRSTAYIEFGGKCGDDFEHESTIKVGYWKKTSGEPLDSD